VPTKHPRIAVTCDDELRTALDQAAAVTGANVPRARLVHDLAVRGAASLVTEQNDRAARLKRLADMSTGKLPAPWDRDVLARIDELAWGYPPDDE
jgi:hypothetical protein